MNFTKEQRQNYFTLVGTISAIDIQENTSAAGVPYIRGTITVKTNESEFNVHFFEMKKWKIGQPDERPNPRFEEIQNLGNGNPVRFSCALEENKFAGRDGTIVSNEQLTLNFINKPNQNDEPGLTFDMVGVVLSPLAEVKNEADELIAYEIKIGQGQYRADRGFSIVSLNVDPNMNSAVNFIRDNYKLNDTVRVSGRGKSIIETTTKKTEALFGEPVVETYQNHKTNYFIEGGLQVSDAMRYSEEEIKALTLATQQFEESEKQRAAAQPKQATSFNDAGPASSGGLAGMLGV